MNHRLIFGALVIACQLMLLQGCTASAGMAPRAAGELPAIKKDCTTCHLSHQQGQGAVLLKMPVSELCLECHQDRKSPAEHKIDVVPSMPVEGLPLTAGKITCTTCHDPHKNVNPRMLRVPATLLCTRCHKT